MIEQYGNRYAVVNEGSVLAVYSKRSYAQEHIQQLNDYVE